MRTVIIDDEPNARQVVRNVLEQYCKSVTIVGEAENVKTGVELIGTTKPELVFLDIRMPDGTGFDILKKLKVINFHFIFITAHEEYALQALKQSALDYILKPINVNELIGAVEKAELSHGAIINSSKKLDVFSDNQTKAKDDKTLVLNTQDSIYYVKISDILSCKADKNYTEVNFLEGKKLVISKTLKDVEEMLNGFGFFRSHQSHLINTAYISHYEKGLGGTIIMKDGSRVPVSSRRKELFIDLMSKQQ